MDADRRSRVLFVLANVGWSLLVLTSAATLIAIALLTGDWPGLEAYAAFGAAAGAALGSVRESRIFQALLGVTGIVLLTFALYWAGGSGVPTVALPLLGAGLIAFGVIAALTRIWWRQPRIIPLSARDLDAAIARPRLG